LWLRPWLVRTDRPPALVGSRRPAAAGAEPAESVPAVLGLRRPDATHTGTARAAEGLRRPRSGSRRPVARLWSVRAPLAGHDWLAQTGHRSWARLAQTGHRPWSARADRPRPVQGLRSLCRRYRVCIGCSVRFSPTGRSVIPERSSSAGGWIAPAHTSTSGARCSVPSAVRTPTACRPSSSTRSTSVSRWFDTKSSRDSATASACVAGARVGAGSPPRSTRRSRPPRGPAAGPAPGPRRSRAASSAGPGEGAARTRIL